MSTHDIYSMSAYYPFLPTGTPPGELSKIKNARICVELPAELYIPKYDGSEDFYADLVSAVGGTATFRIVCAPFFASPIEKAIRISSDTSEADVLNGFVIGDPSVDIPAGAGTYRLHPDCLHFTQAASELSARLRDSVASDETIAGGTQTTFIFADEVCMVDGHNVHISGSADGVTITGEAGLGKGAYKDSPWTDKQAEDLVISGTRGLRSINGQSDAVHIIGIGDVAVTGGASTSATIGIAIDPVEVLGGADA